MGVNSSHDRLVPWRWFLVAICLGWFCIPAQSCISQEQMVSELIFPLHPQHNHAPGIAELANGELIVSWYRGSGERKADDVAVYGARRAVGETTWSEPFLMVDTPGFPDGNTCLMVDSQGRLMLFWPLVLANTWESCVTQLLTSENPIGSGAPKWTRRDSLWLKPDDFSGKALRELDKAISELETPVSESLRKEIESVKERLPDKLYQRLGWQPRCKPTVLKSGRIVLPLYTDTYSFSIMAISDDQGATWRASEPLIGFGNIQPAVLERKDGTLVAYMRENGLSGRVRVCESADQGETWGVVYSSELPNPGSGLDAVRLASGRWIMIHNDTSDGRNRLALSYSDDEGKSWEPGRYLENEPSGSYHYPAIIQTKDGLVHAVYSYFVEGGKSMKHAQFEESWIVSRPLDALNP
ncbi:MAG: exo-alpha-sialidase [Pirellula sp.]|jgi:predicted neuraminidase|nr:exo-alpha-sialidase [Pirellula sp.]